MIEEPINESFAEMIRGLHSTSADTQMVALALYRLTQERPGWDYACRECARRLHIYNLFEEFENNQLSPEEIVAKDISELG